MAMQIFLIRHGETAWSLTGRHTGRTEVPLTGKGERDAANLRERLEKIPFTSVLTSPRQRARRTCELAGFGAVARTETDLQEWDYGDYEGRTTADICQQRPGWNLFADGCPQGESVEEVSHRADRLLSSLRSKDGTVAVFSHGHFLRALAVRWIELAVREGRHFALGTASWSVLGFEHPNSDVPVISLWNHGGLSALHE